MVTFQGVSKEYRRGETKILALRDLSAHIGKGEFCALLGASGSGKSTFLHLTAGLDVPSAGEIFLEGRSTQCFGDTEWTTIRREWVGMVFQAFHLVPGLTARDNFALPLLLKGQSTHATQQAVNEMLAMVGLTHRADHRPDQLSGGEQQRVALARAFVHQPRLILADEPTGNLDSQNGAEVVELLHRCAHQFGQTVIVATHSQTAALKADRQLTLHDGQLRQ